MEQQKTRLKTSQAKPVLQALAPYREAGDTPDDDAPVRACYRYLTNRLDQLDYQGALSNNLPIGSGEIESAHRYIVQARIKRAGAWWKPDAFRLGSRTGIDPVQLRENLQPQHSPARFKASNADSGTQEMAARKA